MVRTVRQKMKSRIGRITMAAGLTTAICGLLVWSLSPQQKASAGPDIAINKATVSVEFEVLAGSIFTMGTNLTVSDTKDILPATAGGSDLGSATAEWGNIYVSDDKGLFFGADQDGSIIHGNTNGVIINSTSMMTFQIGATDILGLDDSAITLAAATNTAGQGLWMQTEDAGGTATSAKTGGAWEIRTGDGSASAGNFAGGAGGAWTIVSGVGGANTGAATGQAGGAGGAIGITTGAGGATNDQGSDNGGAGGDLTLTAGDAGESTGGTGDGGVGGAIIGTAGDGAGTIGGTSGIGGEITFTSGNGAVQPGNDTSGAGGVLTITSGAGGANIGTGSGAAGGAGGTATLQAGVGGTTDSTVAAINGGAGGAVAITAGIGGSHTGAADSGVSGAGGSVTVTTGAGGATAGTGADNGSNAGTFTYTGGAGAANSAGTGDGGTGGGVAFTAGAGGTSAGGTNGTGGAVIIAAGIAAAGDGTGGAITITSGASAGASGTAGALTVDTGAISGGTGAAVTIGGTNATALNLGRAGQPVTLVGQMDRRSSMEHYEEFLDDAGATEALPYKTDILTAGTVDYMADEPLGVLQLAQTAGDAAEAQQLTWGDQLMIDTDNNPIIEFRIRIDNTAGATSVERYFIGLVPVHTNSEDTKDNIDHSVWFLVKGSAITAILVESDDGGANDNGDQASGITLVDDTYTIFKIDMSTLADVTMTVDGVEQSGGTLNMAASSGQVLQPIVCFQRDDNSQTEAIMQIEVDYIQVTQDR